MVMPVTLLAGLLRVGIPRPTLPPRPTLRPNVPMLLPTEHPSSARMLLMNRA